MSRNLFDKYKDYLLADYCYGLTSTDLQGHQIQSPPWSLVLSYEQAIRKKACALMTSERQRFGEALQTAWKDPTKERHFTTPLALYAKRSWPHQPWGDWNPKGKGKGKGKDKGKDKGKGAAATPDGDKICFRFNAGKCSYQKCKFLHVCNKCFAKGHNALNCRGGKGAPTPTPGDTQGS